MLNTDEELNEILRASTVVDVESIVTRLGKGLEWIPLGDNAGNYGIINMAADPYDGITERITNAIDAMIELEVELNPALKRCPSPRKAIEEIHGLKDGNLRWCEQARIGELASDIKVKFLDSGEPKRPTIEIQDLGIGQHPQDFPNTLLSLNKDYKVSKLYLMGAFGQGGQTSFANCTYGIIVSRKHPRLLTQDQKDMVGWTIVRYKDPSTPAVFYKQGWWEYCVESGTRSVLTVKPDKLTKTFNNGTLIRLVSYEMPKGTSDVLQPASTAWSFLSQSLFDPLLPIRLFEARKDYQPKNRALTGLAPRLWGGGKGEKATIWKSDSYDLSLGARGAVRINYWALAPTDDNEVWRDIKKGYVSGSQAVFFTLNGQRHDIETTSFLRDRVNLVYSCEYVIVQVDCDGLTNQSKKELLSTTRDRFKEGEFKYNLLDEIVEKLCQDRNVLAFERERRTKILSVRTERDTSNIKRLVGRYIARDPELAELIQARGKDDATGKKQRKERKENDSEEQDDDEIRDEELTKPDLKQIPTYLKIANARDPIPVEKGGNALIRLEVDAEDSYFAQEWDSRFRVNHKEGITLRRSCSRLRNGKISYYVCCPSSVRVGTTEALRFELDLPEGEPLSVERLIICVNPYERKKESGKQKLPEPKIVPVSKQDAALWSQFSWDESSVGKVYIAKSGESESGIYVSLENQHLRKALQRKKLDKENVRTVEDRFVAGIAYYLLLRYIADKKNPGTAKSDNGDSPDASPELQRLAQTVSVLSLPIEAL